MTQAKWLKAGAAAILSFGMLSACGSDEPEENEMVPGDTEQEENVERNVDPDGSEETDADTNQEADQEAETDGEEQDLESDDDSSN